MADKKVDLRKDKSAEEEIDLKPREINLPGFSGSLPFGAGSFVNRDPNNVPTQKTIDDAKEALASQKLKEAPRPAKMLLPETVNIEDLPLDKQEEIINSIKMANDHMANAPEKIKPSVKFDNKVKEAKPVETSKPTGAVFEEVKAEDAIPKSETTNAPITCKHCGWPVGDCDNTNPTIEDKRAFVAGILGQKRFYKTFNLFDNQMHVTFRTLTTEETDLVIKQLIDDWNKGKISGPSHSVTEAVKYQLVMSISSIDQIAGPVNVEEMSDFTCDKPESGTILPQIVDYVNNRYLASESLRRVVNKAYGHFIDTVVKLEAMAETSDFWKATEA